MNVSDHCNGSSYVHDIALLHKELFCLGTYRFNDGIRQEFFPVEALDTLVQVDTSWNVCSGTFASVLGWDDSPGRPGMAFEIQREAPRCRNSTAVWVRHTADQRKDGAKTVRRTFILQSRQEKSRARPSLIAGDGKMRKRLSVTKVIARPGSAAQNLYLAATLGPTHVTAGILF